MFDGVLFHFMLVETEQHEYWCKYEPKVFTPDNSVAENYNIAFIAILYQQQHHENPQQYYTYKTFVPTENLSCL